MDPWVSQSCGKLASTITDIEKVGGLIDIVGPVWINWLMAMMFGVLLILEFAFLPETLYPRNHMLARSTPKEVYQEYGFLQVEVERTTNLSFINVKPLPGMRHPRPWDSLVRFFLTFQYPVIVLPVIAYCFSWYWWILSIITMIPAAYPTYAPSVQGCLFTGLLLGTWFAELVCSGTLSDWIVRKLTARNGGVQVAEARLWLAYPGALLSAGKFHNLRKMDNY